MSPDDQFTPARVIAPTGEIFLSFPEVASSFVEAGTVASIRELIETRNDLLVESLFRWYRQGQVGCVFARFLASRPSELGWASLVIDPDVELDALAAKIDELTPECEGIQILFRDCTTATALAHLVARLCATPRWWCTEVPWENQASPPGIAIGLRWNPLQKTHTSWVLGIAPFATTPFTRRFAGAPFTALVFRPGPPSFSRQTIDPTTMRPVAHLAHMAIDVSDATADAMETGTIERRRALLTKETVGAARGRVTFALPEECRAILAPAIATGLAMAAE